ncbi:hypothetical protein [Streptomyces sp. CMB-StM0423]|uniref:hypothetical protein n=1 Tax=Streptomyces sp. CMB-StM0423 TaxID=2059884 RepID=UPI001F429C0E|nr:hypothetical protein [Streptomyces sp. CMB-StM0423]
MRDDAHFVARCARGLEPQLAAELLPRELGSITAIGHRSVYVRAWRPYDTGVTGLRTADDVFLLAARGRDVGPRRSAVPALTKLAGGADPDRLLDHRNTLLGNTVDPPGGGGIRIIPGAAELQQV